MRDVRLSLVAIPAVIIVAAIAFAAVRINAESRGGGVCQTVRSDTVPGLINDGIANLAEAVLEDVAAKCPGAAGLDDRRIDEYRRRIADLKAKAGQ